MTHFVRVSTLYRRHTLVASRHVSQWTLPAENGKTYSKPERDR